MKNIVTITLFLLISSAGFAQRDLDENTMQVIKSKKIAFLTEAVGLTTEEAQRFWPVYNEFERKRFQLMGKRNKLELQGDAPSSEMSESAYRKLALEMVAVHKQESKIMEEYNLKFLTILPAEKVVKLYRAEAKFRGYLIREYKKNQRK